MTVLALPHCAIPGTEPIQKVIDLLEEALERARSGKLDGVAIVMVERNPAAFELVYYAQDHRHTMAAGVLAMVHRIGRNMNDDTDNG